MAAFITSNIESVMKGLRTFKGQVPYAAMRALEPDIWVPQLKAVTQATLLPLAGSDPAMRALVPQFVAGVSGRAFRSRLKVRFFLTPPQAFRGTLIALTVNGTSGRNARRAQQIIDDDAQAQEILKDFDEGVRDWVRREKRKDYDTTGVDRGKSIDEITEHILVFFDRRPPKFSPDKDSAEKRAAARADLARHILPFLRKRDQGKAEMDVAEDWLRAVGVAWMAYMTASVPPAMERSIHRLWNQPLRP